MRLVVLLPVLLLACASAPEPLPPREPEPARARAALATLQVENLRAERVTISYRIAGRPSAEVGVGQVGPRQAGEMAPVPAGEPLILIARNAEGAELVLPPRSLDIDSTWVWHITSAERFVTPVSRSEP